MSLGYIRKPYYQHSVHSITRTLPTTSQILVKVGDEVRPEKIVGLGRKSAGFRNIDAAEVLNVKPKELKKLLTKTIGSYVNKGESLGGKKGTLGVGKKNLISPVDGIMTALDETTGIITLEYMPEEVRVVSGVNGTVTNIDPEAPEITIQTKVLEVKGALGLGKRREGGIHIVGQPDLPLSEKQIDPTWENKIIVGGSLLTKQVLYHCVALKVQGIVTGGMHWEEFSSLVGSRGRFEDIGISIVLTEGYGNLSMAPGLFKKLQTYEGKFSFIWGGSSKLIIPDVAEAPTPGHALEFISLAEGQRVRLLTLDHHGELGVISQLNEGTVLDNEIKTDTAVITLNNGETLVLPTTSIEVILDEEAAMSSV